MWNFKHHNHSRFTWTGHFLITSLFFNVILSGDRRENLRVEVQEVSPYEKAGEIASRTITAEEQDKNMQIKKNFSLE